MSAKCTVQLRRPCQNRLGWLGLALSMLLSMPIAHAQTGSETVERRKTEENYEAKPNKRQNSNKPAKRQVEPEAPAKPPLELEALKDPIAPPKPEWQTTLGVMLATLGLAGFWNGLGVTGALAQLVASVLLLFLVFMGLRRLLQGTLNGSLFGRKAKYVDEQPHVRETPTAPAPTAKIEKTAKTTKAAPQTTHSQETPRQTRLEPSMQAAHAQNSQFDHGQFGNSTFGNTAFGNSSFANSSFAPSNSQAGRSDNPADRAQHAAASAAAAAKSAMANKNGTEDYGTIPPNFNVPGFIRKARLYFIRLQIAWDKSDIQNISEITTPEICEEFRRQIIGRGPSDNCTDVVAFDAEILGVKAIGQKFVVTVKITGIVKESMNNAQEAFEEIWRMSRSIAGKETWLLADIKQY